MRTAERTADEKLKNARALASYSLPPYPSLLKLKRARAFSSYDIPHERASERRRRRLRERSREHDDENGLTKGGDDVGRARV